MVVLQKLINWKNELPSIRSWEVIQTDEFSPFCNSIFISLREGNRKKSIVISGLDLIHIGINVSEYICMRIQRDLIDKLKEENNIEVPRDRSIPE